MSHPQNKTLMPADVGHGGRIVFHAYRLDRSSAFYSLAQHSALFSLPISISKPRIMMPLLRMSSANVLKSILFTPESLQKSIVLRIYCTLSPVSPYVNGFWHLVQNSHAFLWFSLNLAIITRSASAHRGLHLVIYFTWKIFAARVKSIRLVVASETDRQSSTGADQWNRNHRSIPAI